MLFGATRTAFFIAVALSLGICSSVQAQGEHARRAGAELRVISGDIRRLQSESISTEQKAGLVERLRGALAPLDLLLRLADQQSNRDDRAVRHYRSELDLLNEALDRADWLAFGQSLNQLLKRFQLSPLRDISSASLNDSKALHQELCAHCHDNPATQTRRPAYNLFDEAKQLASDEFLARMLIGVRGDRITGIDNPLTDRQIGGLIHLYRIQEAN